MISTGHVVEIVRIKRSANDYFIGVYLLKILHSFPFSGYINGFSYHLDDGMNILQEFSTNFDLVKFSTNQQ
jgi:hypothetical protein